MSIIDFSQVDSNTVLETDTCIVGTGPAGISVALQLATPLSRVLMIESGGLARSAAFDALNEFENVGAQRAPHHLVRTRGFGGTSLLWTGRCGALDAIDYQVRPWLGMSGWPIDHSALEPYLDRAGNILGIGPIANADEMSRILRSPYDEPAWDSRLMLPALVNFSRDRGSLREKHPAAPVLNGEAEAEAEGLRVLQHSGATSSTHVGLSMLPVVRKSEEIDTLIHATVTGLHTNEAGTHVDSISISSPDGKRAVIRPKRVVLACGGIENARLLLASNSVEKCGVGNKHGNVGRFLADHTFAEIGTYSRGQGEFLRYRLGNRWLERYGERFIYQSQVRMAPALQRREGLLNCSIHLFERDGQPHPVSVIGAALRQVRDGRFGHQVPRNLIRAASRPLDLAKGIRDRLEQRQPLPIEAEVAIGCVVEQQLDPASRVTLSDELDALGQPKARIDWRISDLEFQTARRMSQLLFDELARLGCELPQRPHWIEEGADAYRERLIDLAHPMCTTRMSDDPTQGVVDANCRVHGVDNLYVAGSSTFGTPGYINPTLTITALGARLGDHLLTQVRKETALATEPRASSSQATRLVNGGTRRLRVGFVGAGHRIRQIYLPALAGLKDELEIAGFVSRSLSSAEQLAKETGVQAFQNAAELVAKERPDFLVCAVSSEAVDGTLSQLVDLGVPFLVETPFAWDLSKRRNLLRRIAKRSLIVGVAEQTPFLPLEQLKRKLIALGLFGRIGAAENSFAVFDYHGIAAARAYLDAGAVPKLASATRAHLPPVADSNAPRDETWTLATVTLSDGSTLVHHYSDAYFDSALRGPRSLRLYGSSGSMDGDIVKGIDRDGRVFECQVQRHESEGRLRSLSLQTPSELYTWQNPYCHVPLTDEQIAVSAILANMCHAVSASGQPAYSPAQAATDMEILTAIRYSCERNGAPISLPLRPLSNNVRRATRMAKSKALGIIKSRLSRAFPT